MAALHIPEFIRANNGSIMHGEEAFLLLLYWLSFPRTSASAQEFYGLEYSQISRFIRAIIRLIMDEWQHLVDDNLDFFAPRFLSYRANTFFCMASWTLNLSILLFSQMVLNVSITETVEPTSVGISIFIVTVILIPSRLMG
jgi:hypothetical protein